MIPELSCHLRLMVIKVKSSLFGHISGNFGSSGGIIFQKRFFFLKKISWSQMSNLAKNGKKKWRQNVFFCGFGR